MHFHKKGGDQGTAVLQGVTNGVARLFAHHLSESEEFSRGGSLFVCKSLLSFQNPVFPSWLVVN